MPKFDSHFRMGEADAAEYARYRLPRFAASKRLEAKEIGDGNINFIFRVRDLESGDSVIVKHADADTRSGSRTLGFDRNRIEAEILKMEGQLAPGLVPEVYDYDPVMACLSMEDLSDHVILRYELIRHKIFPRLAEDISDFMAKTLVPTLDMVMDPARKKELVKRYTNPPLCAITEQLVYTEPYTNKPGRTKVFPPNAAFAERELFSDTNLHLEVAKLKYAFMNDAQALIHGDLHSGSIFVKEDSTKVIDPEFAYFGPIGYDVGNVIGNFCFAWANAQVTMGEGATGANSDASAAVGKDSYIGWLEDTIVATVDLFKAKFLALYKESATDPMGRTPGYAEWFLSTIIADTAGVAGLEMIRRAVGVAQVKDLTSIEPAEARARAERIVVLAAKAYIKDRRNYREGRDFLRALVEASLRPEGEASLRAPILDIEKRNLC
ncbi:MAG: S-methyl-5-thioribose kinase [Rectinemataceae bacterium]|nr:S-methyl-5-thioribose kinase [Rectinemataceae bacterium]